MLLLVGWECHKCSVIFILRFKIRQYFFTSSCSFEGINFVSSLTSRFNIFPASSSSDMAGVFSGDKGGTQRLALIWAGYFSTVKIRFQNLKLSRRWRQKLMALPSLLLVLPNHSDLDVRSWNNMKNLLMVNPNPPKPVYTSRTTSFLMSIRSCS